MSTVRFLVVCTGVVLLGFSSAVAEPQGASPTTGVAADRTPVAFECRKSPQELSLPAAVSGWRSLRIENLGDTPVDTPTVLASGQLDLADVDAIIRHVCPKGMSDAEKAMALYRFVLEHIEMWALPNPSGASRPMQILNLYGYCNCSGFAQTLATLANCAGLKARTLGIGGHAVMEMHYDGAWHLFDSNMMGIYPKADGTLASAEEVHKDLTLLEKANHRCHCPDNYNLDTLRRMYGQGKFGHGSPRNRANLHKISHQLFPEERITWYRDGRAKSYPYQNGSFMIEEPPSGYHAGGTFVYQPDLKGAMFRDRWKLGASEEDLAIEDGGLTVSQAGKTQKLRMRWAFPWPVVGGRVRIAGFRTPKDGQMRIRLYRPERIHFGGMLTDNHDAEGEFDLVFDFDRAAVLPPPHRVLFAVDLELTMYKVKPQTRFLIRSLTVEVDLQRAPKSLPPAELTGKLVYRDGSPKRHVRVSVEPDSAKSSKAGETR